MYTVRPDGDMFRVTCPLLLNHPDEKVAIHRIAQARTARRVELVNCGKKIGEMQAGVVEAWQMDYIPSTKVVRLHILCPLEERV